jgi:hypothetical protein
MLSIGCSCFAEGASNGFIRPTTDLEVAHALHGALSARTQAEFLGRLGTPDNPFVITAETLDALAADQAMRFERLLRHERKATGSATVARLLDRMAAGAAEGVLTAIGGWYLIGIGGVALMFRRNRDAFVAPFPVLPNPTFHPGRHRQIAVLREIMFWVLAPAIGGGVAIMLLFGGWRYRDGAHRFLWSMFFSPLSFLVGLSSMLIALVGFFTPLMAVIGASYGILLITVGSLDGAAAWIVGIVVVAVGTAATVWTFRKAPDITARVLAHVYARFPYATYVVGVALVPLILVYAALQADW